MSKGRIIKVFPGANTSRGFFSLYNYIIPQDATRIFVIKGGPGVGKSTFMKKISQALVEQGYDAEWHCCSSDNGSIDGVVFPRIGVALIDGTAPHIVDPKNPGAVDEIIHLGDNWNEPMLRSSKAEILADNRRVGRLFGIAYFALQEAQIAMNEWEFYISEAQDWTKVNSRLTEFWQKTMGGKSGQWEIQPDERHLFAWAITPQGTVNFIDTLLYDISQLYLLKGEPGSGKSSFIAGFGRRALEMGFDVEFYHNTLNPESFDGIILRQLGIAIFSAGGPFAYQPGSFTGTQISLDLSASLKPEVLKLYEKESTGAKERVMANLNRAIGYIAQAKATHDQMETYYVKAMDFAAIEQRRLEILKRILAYAKEGEMAASTGQKTQV